MRRLIVGVLALGACALAPTAQAAPTLSTDAVTVKDYQMTLSVTKGGGGGGPYTLSVLMSRTAAGATSSQFHVWSFPLGAKAVKLTATSAKIDTGTELGRYGAIKLSIAAGKVARTVYPCYGSVANRRGPLVGALKLTLDDGYFAKVTKRPLKGGIAGSLPAPKPGCGTTAGPGTSGGQPGALTLSAFPQDDPTAGVMLSAHKDARGTVTHSAVMMGKAADIAPATSVMHSVTATAGVDGLAAADDLGTATLAFASPFLSGTAAFAAMAGTNSPTSAFGDLTGSLQVKFDSPGVQTLTALQASLQRS